MGASHIFLTAAFTWGGRLMTSFLRMLRTFVEDGSISMTSHIVEDVDYIYSMEGFALDRDILKTLQVRQSVSPVAFLNPVSFIILNNTLNYKRKTFCLLHTDLDLIFIVLFSFLTSIQMTSTLSYTRSETHHIIFLYGWHSFL
jgi:hypothetical protein